MGASGLYLSIIGVHMCLRCVYVYHLEVAHGEILYDDGCVEVLCWVSKYAILKMNE